MASTAYRRSIDWLFGLQMYGIKLGLHSITRLLDLLGNPQKTLNVIHIAGTNGKGSTAAYLHSMYCRAGYQPGLYTSPHLTDFTERIRIGTRSIARGSVVELTAQLRGLCRRNALEHITFFEFTTALAIAYFARRQADPVILEAGLGGRLDATNVVEPLVSVITSISREHTVHLGPTLSHIAREKAGIIKRGRPCISGVTACAPRECIRGVCRERRAPLFEYGRDFAARALQDGSYRYCGPGVTHLVLRPGLVGLHQARNASLAVTAAAVLGAHGYELSGQNIQEGIQRCHWPGRLEAITTATCPIVLDGAHNPAAWHALACSLRRDFSFRRLILVMGVMRDKDIRALQRLTALAHLCIYFRPDMDRAAGREHLEKYTVFSIKKKVLWCETIAESLKAALREAGPGDLICITGSLFAVGEARELLCGPGKRAGRRIGL